MALKWKKEQPMPKRISDKERLDWMRKNFHSIQTDTLLPLSPWQVWIDGEWLSFERPRQAIDAALKSQPRKSGRGK